MNQNIINPIKSMMIVEQPHPVHPLENVNDANCLM